MKAQEGEEMLSLEEGKKYYEELPKID